MATKFNYSDEEWAKIEPFVTEDSASVRRELEAAGARYLLSTLPQIRGRDPALKWIWEKRRKIARCAAALFEELNTLEPGVPEISPVELGMGALAPSIPKARILMAQKELEDFRSALGRIVAWLGAEEEIKFFPRRSSAHKPAKSYLVARVLSIWEKKLDRKIPSNGGGPSGPTSLYLQATCNPILRLGKDGQITTGDQARKLIQRYLENRT